MKPSLRKKVSLDNVQFYMSRGAIPTPDLYDVFLEDLSILENNDKLCLVPIAIFQRFHNRLRKTA